MTKIARQTQSCWRYKDDGSFSCKEIMLVIAENETRAHGVGVSRELYLYPRPLEGENWGRFFKPAYHQRKKAVNRLPSFLLSGKRDSNSRPQPWQGCALPTELFPQLFYELATGFIRLRVQR